jgi:hypothetical protein
VSSAEDTELDHALGAETNTGVRVRHAVPKRVYRTLTDLPRYGTASRDPHRVTVERKGVAMSLALIGAGVLFGIFLLGLWGDVVIGTLVVGAARLAEAMVRPVAHTWRRARHGPSFRAPAEPRPPAALVRAGSSER